VRNQTRFTYVLALVACLSVFLSGCVRTVYVQPESAEGAGTAGFHIAYAEGTTAVEDPDALQKIVDEMRENARKTIGLEYKNEAFSVDGQNFDCYIANAARNQYDMFIAIYADAELTDELYLSGLVMPGRAFEHIQLERPLEDGNHLVYVAFSQVEEVDGEQTMRAQALVTMNFHVNDFPDPNADSGAADDGSDEN
jgi:hypothetical protein